MKSLKLIVAVLVVATAFVVAGSVAIAQSGASAPATGNIAVTDGINPGEVVVSWDAVPGATHYRIGYVNMITDYPLAKASVTGDWINAFIYVDENARNVPVANGRAEYTVRRLEQDVRHAFTVLTSSNFVDTGAAGSVSSEFSWPSNPRWKFHRVADRGGAPATAPSFDFVSMYPNCDAVRAHYPGGVRRGSPIYRPALDRNEDGVACESASSTPSGSYLPIQSIGTFTGTGDNADNVVRLDTGLHRVTSTHANGTRNFIVRLEGISSDDWELVANEIGVARVVDTVRIGTGFLQNEPGNYLLTVLADGDWEINIELIGGN